MLKDLLYLLMIHLDRNENRYGPAPKCYEVLTKVDKELFISYTPKYFTDEITSKLSSVFNFPEDQIILEYGGENILRLIFDHIVKIGDVVLVSDFSWNYYAEQIKRRGGKRKIFKVTKSDYGFNFDVDDLIKKYKLLKPVLVLVTSPNNPTGNSLSFSELDKFMKLTTKRTLVVLDEAYFGFQKDYDQSKINKIILKYPNLLILRTFSKLYALAGLRIGYALCGKEALKRLSYQKRYLGYNRISEKVAVAALGSEDYYNEVRDKIVEDRSIIFQEINKIKGWKAYQSSANFILIEFPIEIKDTLKSYLLEKKLVVKFHDDKKLNNILRLTIGVKEETQLFLDTIKEFLKK